MQRENPEDKVQLACVDYLTDRGIRDRCTGPPLASGSGRRLRTDSSGFGGKESAFSEKDLG